MNGRRITAAAAPAMHVPPTAAATAKHLLLPLVKYGTPTAAPFKPTSAQVKLTAAPTKHGNPTAAPAKFPHKVGGNSWIGWLVDASFVVDDPIVHTLRKKKYTLQDM